MLFLPPDQQFQSTEGLKDELLTYVRCRLQMVVGRRHDAGGRRDSSVEDDDEEELQVMLYWDKEQKSIRDLVLDHQPHDHDILTYYRYCVCDSFMHRLHVYW